jgi:hypothetical protein
MLVTPRVPQETSRPRIKDAGTVGSIPTQRPTRGCHWPPLSISQLKQHENVIPTQACFFLGFLDQDQIYIRSVPPYSSTTTVLYFRVPMSSSSNLGLCRLVETPAPRLVTSTWSTSNCLKLSDVSIRPFRNRLPKPMSAHANALQFGTGAFRERLVNPDGSRSS